MVQGRWRNNNIFKYFLEEWKFLAMNGEIKKIKEIKHRSEKRGRVYGKLCPLSD